MRCGRAGPHLGPGGPSSRTRWPSAKGAHELAQAAHVAGAAPPPMAHTAARACWGRHATSTTLHRPWSTYAYQRAFSCTWHPLVLRARFSRGRARRKQVYNELNEILTLSDTLLVLSTGNGRELYESVPAKRPLARMAFHTLSGVQSSDRLCSSAELRSCSCAPALALLCPFLACVSHATAAQLTRRCRL